MADTSPTDPEHVDATTEPTPRSSPKPQAGRGEAATQMTTPMRAYRPFGLQEGLELSKAAAQVAIDNKASDVLVVDVSEQSAEFDFFVLATGTSRRQLHAISEQIDDKLQKEMGDVRRGIEGYQESSWIVLDYGSVIIHLFDEETRAYYDLETLWADGSQLTPADLGLIVD